MKISHLLSAFLLCAGCDRTKNAVAADLASPVAQVGTKENPHATPSTPPASEPEILLKILADGSYQLGNVNGSDEEIFAALKKLLETQPTARIRISGTATTKYQRVVEAVDLCQRCGIDKIAFKTDRPPANDNPTTPTP